MERLSSQEGQALGLPWSWYLRDATWVTVNSDTVVLLTDPSLSFIGQSLMLIQRLFVLARTRLPTCKNFFLLTCLNAIEPQDSKEELFYIDNICVANVKSTKIVKG